MTDRAAVLAALDRLLRAMPRNTDLILVAEAVGSISTEEQRQSLDMALQQGLAILAELEATAPACRVTAEFPYCVYAHRRDGRIFYIGKGRPNRPFERRDRTDRWDQEARHGYEVVFLGWYETEKEALEAESSFIWRLQPAANFHGIYHKPLVAEPVNGLAKPRGNTHLRLTNSFDKRAYQRDYMRRRRARA